MISDESPSWMMMSMSWGAWHQALSGSRVFSRGRCGVMRLITWIMAPLTTRHWLDTDPFYSRLVWSSWATDCLLKFLGLVSRITPGAQRSAWARKNYEDSSTSFTTPFLFIHMFSSIAFHTCKRHLLNINPRQAAGTKSVQVLVLLLLNINQNVVLFHLLKRRKTFLNFWSTS